MQERRTVCVTGADFYKSTYPGLTLGRSQNKTGFDFLKKRFLGFLLKQV